ISFTLMPFDFYYGHTLTLLHSVATDIGSYIQSLPGMSVDTLHNNGNGTAKEWQANWTLFYWGWWISWSPFVGMFIARISYGRTIRQFITGALFAPVGASMVWLGIFGESAL